MTWTLHAAWSRGTGSPGSTQRTLAIPSDLRKGDLLVACLGWQADTSLPAVSPGISDNLGDTGGLGWVTGSNVSFELINPIDAGTVRAYHKLVGNNPSQVAGRLVNYLADGAGNVTLSLAVYRQKAPAAISQEAVKTVSTGDPSNPSASANLGLMTMTADGIATIGMTMQTSVTPTDPSGWTRQISGMDGGGTYSTYIWTKTIEYDDANNPIINLSAVGVWGAVGLNYRAPRPPPPPGTAWFGYLAGQSALEA